MKHISLAEIDFSERVFEDVEFYLVYKESHFYENLVNYDNVDMDMQRRICDFMNGACYVLGGDARRISSNMVLYVPAGVNIGDACTDVSSMFSMR